MVAVFQEYSDIFDKDKYLEFLSEIGKIMKTGNVYFLEEDFVDFVMEKK